MYTIDDAFKRATLASFNSPCQSKRGVVIWDDECGYIAQGWNHLPLPFIYDSSKKCKASCNMTVIHAEQHAILRARQHLDGMHMIHVKSVDEKAVYSDKPTCVQCSKLILEVGIATMTLYTINGLRMYTAEEFHRQSLINNHL